MLKPPLILRSQKIGDLDNEGGNANVSALQGLVVAQGMAGVLESDALLTSTRPGNSGIMNDAAAGSEKLTDTANHQIALETGGGATFASLAVDESDKAAIRLRRCSLLLTSACRSTTLSVRPAVAGLPRLRILQVRISCRTEVTRLVHRRPQIRRCRLCRAVPATQATTTSGNAGSTASDSEPCPTLTLNATDPAHATFTVSGLASDVHGTVTFADVNGVQDVVNIGTNGTYAADLSNLANGTIDYTLAVTDPMGHTTIVDPPVQLGTVAGFTLDANGWPIITPPASAHIIYVSSSTGNDNNDGLTPATAKATIAGGEALLRNGQPDELLLKAGDTFVNQSFGYLHVSGQSMTAPMVFGTYGSGPAPIVETPANGGIAIGNSGGGGGNFIVVEGINFYAYTRDPSNPAYAGPNTTESGAAFFGTANVLLVGNKFSFFTDDIVFTPNGSVIDPSSSLTLYRNVITNSWSTTEHSQGLYAAGAGTLDIEQNIFDHNGWNASIPGAEANIFNRNVYFSALNAPVTFIGNVSANSSSEGAQFRSGGTITNNLFVADSLGFSIGSNPAGSGEASPTITSSVATGNVILNSNDIQSAEGSLLRSSGIGVTNASGAGVQVTNNIIADPVNSHGTGICIDSNVSGVNTSNNIIYNYFDVPESD